MLTSIGGKVEVDVLMLFLFFFVFGGEITVVPYGARSRIVYSSLLRRAHLLYYPLTTIDEAEFVGDGSIPKYLGGWRGCVCYRLEVVYAVRLKTTGKKAIRYTTITITDWMFHTYRHIVFGYVGRNFQLILSYSRIQVLNARQ